MDPNCSRFQVLAALLISSFLIFYLCCGFTSSSITTQTGILPNMSIC
ncbi:hypothetical protein CsSME_00047551 [Camellia sinensis var. sinensis]